MTQPIDPTELAETLRDWCVDYDGEHITPEAEPRTIPTCAELRQVANTILAQAARIEALEEALRSIAEGNLGADPWQADYNAIRNVARAALSPKEPTMTPELKPCPKLQGKLLALADYFEPNDLSASATIREAAEAIAAWNRRTSPPAADTAARYGVHYAGSGGASTLGANIITREQSAPDTAALVRKELAEAIRDAFMAGSPSYKLSEDWRDWTDTVDAVLPIITRREAQAFEAGVISTFEQRARDLTDARLDGVKAGLEAAAKAAERSEWGGDTYIAATSLDAAKAIRAIDPTQLWKDRTP